MLRELAIRDFVIVKELSLPLENGFSVLTGETGAGKSILIDALGLVLGGRASGEVVASGMKRAEITAVFDPSEPAINWLKENDLETDEDLILRRVIDSQGKSRAYINGSIVPLNQLRDLGDRLVDIHGQHMHQSLMKGDVQRDLLDAQGHLLKARHAVWQAWEDWQQSQRLLTTALESAHQVAEKKAQLTWQLQTLEKLAPAPGEWEKICDEHSRLSHGQSLLEATSSALVALDDDQAGAQRLLAGVLERIRGVLKHDSKLNDIEQSLEGASIAMAQARSDLSRYVDALDLDPGRLDQLEQRLKSLYDAAQKFHCEPAELPALVEQTEQALAAIDQAQDTEALGQRVAQAAARFETLAASLSSDRKKNAKRLAKAVTKHMQSLGMPGGQFDIAIVEAPASFHGVDKITFMVAGHEGAALAPLNKVASGGELSRIALALSVVASEGARVPTLIFDEIDSGVSGAVAEKVGQLLRDLGQRHQVLCVTHLPQVAACGNHHHQVTKFKAADGHITSTVETLSETTRVQAIAALLGGSKITATTRHHAEELLKQQLT